MLRDRRWVWDGTDIPAETTLSRTRIALAEQCSVRAVIPKRVHSRSKRPSFASVAAKSAFSSRSPSPVSPESKRTSEGIVGHTPMRGRSQARRGISRSFVHEDPSTFRSSFRPGRRACILTSKKIPICPRALVFMASLFALLTLSWSLSWLKPWSADAACHEAHGAELLSGTPFNNSTGDLVSIGAFLATRLLATEMYSFSLRWYG